LIIPPSLIFGFIPKPFSSNASKVFKTDSSKSENRFTTSNTGFKGITTGFGMGSQKINALKNRLFVVLCGYTHKNQRGLEVKNILSTGNDEEPKNR